MCLGIENLILVANRWDFHVSTSTLLLRIYKTYLSATAFIHIIFFIIFRLYFSLFFRVAYIVVLPLVSDFLFVLIYLSARWLT